MKLLVISSSGDSLPLCLQMQEEGVDVTTYIHNQAFRTNYEGMLKQRLKGVDDLIAWIKETNVDDTTILFDMSRTYKEDVEEDVEFLRVRGADPKTARAANLFGPTADWLVDKGFRVMGCSSWGENLEMDRKRGKTFAGQMGLEVPDHIVAQSLGGAINVLETRFSKMRSVLKPFSNGHLDCTYIEEYKGELLEKLKTPWSERVGWPAIIEEYIPGTTFDEEIWFDGNKLVWSTLNSTLELKRFGNEDTGPNVGSSLNLVWSKKKAVVNWSKMESALRKANYIGPINATFQIRHGNGKMYFLEWACRFGYDAIFAFSWLPRVQFGHFLLNGFKGGFNDDGYAASVRVSIPPYPYEEATLRHTLAEGVPITPSIRHSVKDVRYMDVRSGPNGMECAGADGIVYVATGFDDNAATAFSKAYAASDRVLVAADKQYRSDWQNCAEGLKIVPADQRVLA